LDDPVLTALFWAMLALCVLVLAWPWRFDSRAARLFVHLPLLLPAMYAVYEWRMPPEMNIRVDLLIFLPLFAADFGCYGVRLWQLARRARGSGDA
jgi:hypothetical protein